MTIRDNINIYLPNKWQMEENGDSVSIYNNNGHGAITMSFYKIIENSKSIIEFISEKAVSFTKQAEIKLDNIFIIDVKKDGNILLSGTGKMPNCEFIKIYILANNAKFVLITYNAVTNNKEIKIVDKIVESIVFI